MDDLIERLQATARHNCAFAPSSTHRTLEWKAAAELSRLTDEAERLRAALLAAKLAHDTCEDCWYSCPASGECCNNGAGSECNCGADRHNAAIDAALAAIKEAGNG